MQTERQKEEMTARILLLDIETAPSLGYVWEAWQTNVIDFRDQWYILCYAWKFLGEKTQFLSLQDVDEHTLIQQLWNLFNEADIVVGHKVDTFDIKRSNAMFLRYGLPPPSPYKTVDTLKVVKKYFKLDKNSLGDVGKYLGLGDKKPNQGWKTWLGTMQGDPEAWAVMRDYNIQDVDLLERIYLTLRPWHTTHPNLNLWSEHQNCPTCGSGRIQRRGFSYAKVQVRQRYHCQDCGHWWSGKVEKKSVL